MLSSRCSLIPGRGMAGAMPNFSCTVCDIVSKNASSNSGFRAAGGTVVPPSVLPSKPISARMLGFSASKATLFAVKSKSSVTAVAWASP